MLTLEKKLTEDTSGHTKNELIRTLYMEINKVEVELNSGVPPDRFPALSGYRKSLQEATDVIDQIWNLRHRHH